MELLVVSERWSGTKWQARFARSALDAFDERLCRGVRSIAIPADPAAPTSGWEVDMSEKFVVIHEDDIGLSHGANTAFRDLWALGRCMAGSLPRLPRYMSTQPPLRSLAKIASSTFMEAIASSTPQGRACFSSTARAKASACSVY